MTSAETLVLVCAILAVWLGLDILVRVVLALADLSLWLFRKVSPSTKGRNHARLP